MINSIAIYYDTGKKVAIANRRRDYSLSSFHTDWYRRALRLESEKDRAQAEQAFKEGVADNTTKATVFYY